MRYTISIRDDRSIFVPIGDIQLVPIGDKIAIACGSRVELIRRYVVLAMMRLVNGASSLEFSAPNFAFQSSTVIYKIEAIQ